jgi:hypothetical protein
MFKIRFARIRPATIGESIGNDQRFIEEMLSIIGGDLNGHPGSSSG